MTQSRLTRGGMGQRSLRHMVLLSWSLVAVLPLYFMISSALKTKAEFVTNLMGPPTAPTLANFQKVLTQRNFIAWIGNSFLITAVSVGLALVVATLAAYALTHLRFPGRTLILHFVVGLMAVPIVVMILPLFALMVRFNLINTRSGVVIVYVGIMIPFMVFFLAAFFSRIPSGIIESAKIDGASSFRVLWHIVLPLSRPALATMAVVNALFAWNELLVSLVLLQVDKRRTLMVGLTVFRDRFSIDVPVTSAGLVIAIVPIIALYLISQRAFVSGLNVGATKGE